MRIDLFVDMRTFGAAGGIRVVFERLGASGSLSYVNRVYRSFTLTI